MEWTFHTSQACSNRIATLSTAGKKGAPSGREALERLYSRNFLHAFFTFFFFFFTAPAFSFFLSNPQQHMPPTDQKMAVATEATTAEAVAAEVAAVRREAGQEVAARTSPGWPVLRTGGCGLSRSS